MCTHPIVWFVLPRILPFARYVPGVTPFLPAAEFFVLAEGFAVMAEALYLRFFSVTHALAWSAAANAASASIGGVLSLLAGWP